MPRRRERPPQFPIAPILEYLGGENVPALFGSGYRKMLCPFHPERTPSASVSRYGFTCFGCEITGDALKLLMARENMSFPEALEKCRELTGEGGDASDASAGSGWEGDLLV